MAFSEGRERDGGERDGGEGDGGEQRDVLRLAGRVNHPSNAIHARHSNYNRVDDGAT